MTSDSIVRSGVTTAVSFAYDAFGRRVAETVNGATTCFIYDGNNVVLDVNATTKGLIAEYAFDPNGDLFGLRTPTDTAVVVATPTNHAILGLARLRGGAPLKQYDPMWMPWGDTTSDVSGIVLRYRMASEELDQETGLYHLGARYYDPQMNRFLSEDPAGIASGVNLYAYANQDPVTGLDPTGLDGATPNAVWSGCDDADHNAGFCDRDWFGNNADGSTDAAAYSQGGVRGTAYGFVVEAIEAPEAESYSFGLVPDPSALQAQVGLAHLLSALSDPAISIEVDGGHLIGKRHIASGGSLDGIEQRCHHNRLLVS